MRVAIIGANGRLGGKVTKQALDRGHEVKAIICLGEAPDERAELLEKSLFDLTWEDISDVDVLFSAYGSGFDADPSLNKKAFLHYIKLLSNTSVQLIAIGGAGCLFVDSSHTSYSYEQPDHPAFLKGISENIKLGLEELIKTKDMDWTLVCPSKQFDPEGPLTGEYIIGTEDELIYNEDGNSYVTYDDLAKAMVDIAETGSYKRKRITVATRTVEESAIK